MGGGIPAGVKTNSRSVVAAIVSIGVAVTHGITDPVATCWLDFMCHAHGNFPPFVCLIRHLEGSTQLEYPWYAAP